MTSQQDDDWALLARARREPDALEALFRRHRDTVFRFALARCADEDLAHDISQELFLRLAEYRRPVFRRAKFSTWLYRITSNLAVDSWRKQARHQDLPAIDAVTAIDGDAETHTDLARVMAIMRELPDRQRQTFHLRILEQWSTEDTATAMGISTASVKTHLQRALGAVRTQLEDSTNETP